MRFKRFAFCCFASVLSLISLGARAAVILQYHHVDEATPASTSTTPARFAEHMAYLQEHEFTVMALPELLDALKDGRLLPEKTVAITFDDGYDSIYREAFPVLKKHGYPFTVFLNTAPMEAKGFLSWAQVQEMIDSGASMANHTVNHPHLVRKREDESEEQWQARIRSELKDAQREIVKHTGQDYPILAYPYGEFDARVKGLVESLGFIGVGQHSGAVGRNSDWLALPRFPMGGNYAAMDSFATKVNTLPLPLEQVKRLDREGKALSDAVVRAGERPQLILQLASKSLAQALQCYQQGKALPGKVEGASVHVRAEQALTPGRSRFNCTARDEKTGRYYWYSEPWLVSSKEGQWVHEE